jgi:hypothetical protein
MRAHSDMRQNGLAVGDLVHLNSGSPPLAIVGARDGELTVEWDSPNGRARLVAPAVCFSRATALEQVAA